MGSENDAMESICSSDITEVFSNGKQSSIWTKNYGVNPNALSQENPFDLQLLERPGCISNACLIDFSYPDELTLKANLIEHHDYEAIPQKVWFYLISWYNFTDMQPIIRPVGFDRKSGTYFIDLYLE